MLETNQCIDLQCPIQYALNLVSNKWAVLILRELFLGDRRTHHLLEALPGISTKTLTGRLRELEAQGLVSRTVYPEIPPHVEYSLTEKGQSLRPLMVALYEVGSHLLDQENCACPLNETEKT